MCAVPGSRPGTQRASVNGGLHVGAAEEGKPATPVASHGIKHEEQEARWDGPYLGH